MVVVLMRHQPRRAGLILAGLIVLLSLLVTARATGPAKATSGGSPYDIPQVVDTNPDPNIVETTLTAENASVDVGNGVTANVETFNGSLPGPEFRLKVGDTVIVHFKNELAEVTGIHWHGIELANASDGTPLTQNQVAPGDTFLYKFKVSRPGIFWYHPHHHASTNQVFKGLYGAIIVTDPNEAALQASGVLPSAAQTRTLALSDITVCKAAPNNDTATFDSTLPHISGGSLPGNQGETPKELCETKVFDDEGNTIPGPLNAGDVPNIQKGGTSGPVAEGQTVLTNGKNVGGRAGDQSAPGALAPGASTLDVQPGQGLRLQIGNTATTRFFRLRLTDGNGAQIPLIRIGGQGGLLDQAVEEGGSPGGFNTHYTLGEILLDPGDRADVVAAIPSTATGTLTMWTEDFERTGPDGSFPGTPTVPVMHLNVTGPVVSPAYTIAAGTQLRAATGDPVPVLGAATGSLLEPTSFSPVKTGLTPTTPDIQLTNQSPGPNTLGINAIMGSHDNSGDYAVEPHMGSTRYAKLGDTLDLSVTNKTGAHHPFHLHGFSMQPISLTKAASPTFTFPHEFADNVDVPGGYTLNFKVKLEDRALMDGVTPGGGLGRWVFHCHIFFHATFGMISEFDVVAANGNEKPTVNADDASVKVDGGTTATMHGTYHDPDGDAVTLSASLGSLSDHGDGTYDWSFPTTTSTASQLVYVTATDAGGKKDQVAFQLVINDVTPPTTTITLTPPAPNGNNGWYTQNVDVAISAVDNAGGSGVAETRCVLDPVSVPASFDALPAPPCPFVPNAAVTTDGLHTVYAASSDANGNKESPVVSASFKIDKTPPTVTCDPPTPRVFFIHGPGGPVTATVSDTTSGPVTVALSQTVTAAEANVAGLFSKSFTGTDNAGNQTVKLCPYIISYKFGGFLQPIPQSRYQAGSNIPVKFMLLDANDVKLPDAEALAVAANCGVRILFTGGTPSPNCATYDPKSDQFQFNLNTSKSLASGTYTITVEVLAGGNVVTTATVDVIIRH